MWSYNVSLIEIKNRGWSIAAIPLFFAHFEIRLSLTYAIGQLRYPHCFTPRPRHPDNPPTRRGSR